MPKMRGFLHGNRKIPEEEWELAHARTAVRLADLFGAAGLAETLLAEDPSPDVVEDGVEPGEMPSSAVPGPGPGSDGRRPSIIVLGDGDDVVGVETEIGQVNLVGVMAQPGDNVGDDSWQLPQVAGLLAAPAPHPVAPRAPARRGSSRAKPARSAAGRSPARRTTRTKARVAPVPTAYCPYCAGLLQPAPGSNRRCERCRQRIIVKRVEGRAVYLTEAALPVFEAERRRAAVSVRLTREREHWLRLAAVAGAPAERLAHLTAARLSEDVVVTAQAFYITTCNRAFRAAQRDREWEKASRIRRQQATVLYRVAGSPLPPPAELIGLFREGVAAELRGIAEMSRDAELVSASCCAICRADDRQTFRIAQQLRMPRLPHEGCPRGLCRCGWDLAARHRTTMRRYLRRRPEKEPRAAPNEPVATA
jgi:hypothetical protein